MPQPVPPSEREIVIVTGCGGLIGRAVCSALADDGHRVFGFDRAGNGDPLSRIEVVLCDVTSEQSVVDALSHVRRAAGESIAAVVHLETHHDFSGEPSPLYEEITIQGTERLLRLLRCCRVKQFVFASTMLVHAPSAHGERISEDSPIDPRWDYPSATKEAEEIIASQHGVTPVLILRLADVYTERGGSIALAHQIQRIYERRLTARVFPGSTSAARSFVHVHDVVRAIRAALQRRATLPDHSVVLLGEPEPPSYDELQKSLAMLIHREADWETVTIPKAVAKAGSWIQDVIPGVEEPFIEPWMIDLADADYILDTARARSLLHWSAERRLVDTLPKIVGALLTDPVRWYREHHLSGSPPVENGPTHDPASWARGARRRQ